MESALQPRDGSAKADRSMVIAVQISGREWSGQSTRVFTHAAERRYRLVRRGSRRLQGAEAHLVMRVVLMLERWAVATDRGTSCRRRQWERLLWVQQERAQIG